MRIERFVLDCNIWISYLITGKAEMLAQIIEGNGLTVFSCEELLEEIERVLGYDRLKRYKVNTIDALKLVRKITVHQTLQYPIKRYLPDDENDDYIIALALQTSSGFITSGDDDILSQKANLEKKYKKLKILTKAEFEGMFG